MKAVTLRDIDQLGLPETADSPRRLRLMTAAGFQAGQGDADAALRIVTNNKMVAGWKPDRVKASFDAWVERCESREFRYC